MDWAYNSGGKEPLEMWERMYGRVRLALKFLSRKVLFVLQILSFLAQNFVELSNNRILISHKNRFYS